MLLTIDNFSLSFIQDDSGPEPTETQVLHKVSLDVSSGRTTALVGESGSGKSVTALSILRLLEDTSNTVSSGRILFKGRDVFSLSPKQIRSLRGNHVSMIFQEPMTSLNPVYTIGNQLIEPLLLHRALTKKEAEIEAIHLLERTGIPDPRSRLTAYPHQLSGGQRQRVMIAMALACRPALLIADEPTTALDVTIQAQILNLMQDLQEEFNMGILLITHDLAMVKRIADQVHIMQNGRIVEQGPTDTLFDNPQESYTIHLLESVPSGEPEPLAAQRPLLDISHLSCQFKIKTGGGGFWGGGKKIIQAVDNVNLIIPEGSSCGIVGESGSGKTTLGMAILKLVKSQGSILFGDRDLQPLSTRTMRPLRKEIQVVFQDPFSSLSPRMTVGQIVEEGMKVHKLGGNKEQRMILVQAALAEVGLEPEHIFRYPHEFSGGQRQRIAIARAIVLKPRLLILDEPTSALDMTIQKQIIDLLKGLQEKYGMTYIFISHDLRVIRAMVHQVAVMHEGRIVESGPASELFALPRHPYTKQLFQAAFGT
ncbi:MAG: ABC transporter ATP-binding protein [Desulfobulbaceae bacterium]|uniref:ABC transporter ATP-binding protein n=1 Tax=Candidatus Desulfatifera sulfidica TaxID=2841691 RepID=A0A8J6NBV2_9BACT|nr:ABC transporter ATP-binding protein [Candidatus Desulfatifera sulfidica]